VGLDQIELLLRTEEVFGINIKDEEAVQIETVGDLFELISTKVPHTGPAQCITQTAFYRARRALGHSGASGAAQIRPATPLSEVVPKGRAERRRFWQSCANEQPLEWPALSLSRTWSLIFLLASTSATYMAALYFTPIRTWYWIPVVIGACYAILFWAAPYLRDALPASTVGDLARQLALLNRDVLQNPGSALSRQSLWELYVELVSDQLGIAPEVVRPEASWGPDLGVD